MLNKVMVKQMARLGAEPITIDGTEVFAVPAEVDSDRDLMGGSRDKRDLDYQFPTRQDLKIRKGATVEADGKKWKIENFRRGRAMTTISLIEPNRIEE